MNVKFRVTAQGTVLVPWRRIQVIVIVVVVLLLAVRGSVDPSLIEALIR
ncbi:hypothetical protein [Streptomyces sp. 8N706]